MFSLRTDSKRASAQFPDSNPIIQFEGFGEKFAEGAKPNRLIWKMIKNVQS